MNEDPNDVLLQVRGLDKQFTLHTQNGITLPVLAGIDLDVSAGECVALVGPSGCGKSSLMRCLYGNYAPSAGSIRIRHREQWLDLATATPREVIDVRRHSVGYVSQFLRVIPRVTTIEIVAEPLRRLGMAPQAALERAADLLARLAVPSRLWSLPPATFSGGEQQRVNIARGLIAPRKVLLLDEPTASLDATNRQIVVDLIGRARDAGAAIVGIFHDAEVRNAIVTRNFDLEPHRPRLIDADGEPQPA